MADWRLDGRKQQPETTLLAKTVSRCPGIASEPVLPVDDDNAVPSESTPLGQA